MTKVGIAVCTMKRPKLLATCLASLSAQTNVSDLNPIIIVIDNDTEGSAKPVVDAFAVTSPYPVVYAIEPVRGISSARNRALEELIKADVSWFAFIDDDQHAHESWLSSHYEVATEHNADMVQPQILKVIPSPEPFWCFERNDALTLVTAENDPVGSTICVGTNGSFYSSRLIKSEGLGLRFDMAFNLAGGEDAVFSRTATQRGAKGISSHRPIVFEYRHPSRFTVQRYAERGLASGARHVTQTKIEKGLGAAIRKYPSRAITRTAKGLGQIAVAPLVSILDVKKGKFTALEGARNIYVAAGFIGGLFGYEFEYYSRIDGN